MFADDLLKDVLSTLGNAISRVAKLEIIEPTDRFCPGACDPKLVSPLLYRLPAGCELTPEQEKIGRIRKKLVSEPFERLYQAENYKTVVETQSDRYAILETISKILTCRKRHPNNRFSDIFEKKQNFLHRSQFF